MEIIIRKVVENYIKAHALQNKGNEIFGWLVGSENKDSLQIECAISSHRYLTQNIIAAEPDLTETGIISSVLPLGLGIIGMYHSHPAKVFHSSTDDRTLIQLTTLYPHAISIVTNGNDFKVFKMDGNESVETKYKKEKSFSTKFKQIKFDIKGKLVTVEETVSKNDVITAIEKAVRELYEDSENRANLAGKLKKGIQTVEIIKDTSLLENDIASEIKEWNYELRTILDISQAKYDNKDTLVDSVINSLQMNLLLQLKTLVFDVNNRNLVFSERKTITFMDIPLHGYLEPDRDDSPLHQFFDDMALRRSLIR
ncbi:MAG: Mov34/MPN/PAD-1 family protein [Candidatus Hodarchaeales archaeon]